MKRFPRLFLVVLLFLMVYSVFSLSFGYSFVIPITPVKMQKGNESLNKGDTLNFFKRVDFTKGKWRAYINLSRNDFSNLAPTIEHVSCLKTSDVQVLKKMQKQWNFIYKDADAATVESYIYVFKDNELVFKSGIVLDSNKQGLQNSSYGWIEPLRSEALLETCREFKRVYWPVVFL